MIPKECKRLAEVDFPIAEVSRHAAREKSIRHGHPSTLHLWWARRPLAACRAVLLALLLPDPCDENCPGEFRETTRRLLERVPGRVGSSNEDLRKALLKFIGDFANWDLSSDTTYLEVSRGLIKAAHGEEPPLVVDSFAGGGSIPLEALRLGCDAFASDLNPVACLILKVMLEDIPRHGAQLAGDLRRVGAEIRKDAESDLAEFYPPDPDGSRPTAYLWARTVWCESPNCGAEIPLMRSFWLSKKASRKRALRHSIARPKADVPRVDFEVFEPNSDREVLPATITRAKATCLACNTVLSPERVRAQLFEQRGGADVIFDSKGGRVGGARLLAVVTLTPGEQGRRYRLSAEHDYKAVRSVIGRLEEVVSKPQPNGLSPVPDEPLPPVGTLGFRVQRYGMLQWGDLFTSRQKLALTTIASKIRSRAGDSLPVWRTVAPSMSKMADTNSALCTWQIDPPRLRATFARQALPMTWDFAEASPLGDGAGNYGLCVSAIGEVLDASPQVRPGVVQQSDATELSLAEESGAVWFTDPPYYDAVPYAHLSDFFLVWLKRAAPDSSIKADPYEAANPLSPKSAEIVQDESGLADGGRKDRAFFEEAVARAFRAGRRLLATDAIGCVVFAHKTTEGWEALLSGLVRGGWTITGSWPIASELASRQRARESAALATSVHLVCRPRPNEALIGDWGDVLQHLPVRVGDWMERLQREGVRGADLVFACIGPALEIFSRFSSVVDAEDREIPLGGDPEATEPHKRGYLAYVWEVVGRTALAQVLGTVEGRARNGAATALEEDARLTALFLWTLQSTNGGEAKDRAADDDEEVLGDDEEKEAAPARRPSGLSLIYDVVRRFAQPLGIHLKDWEDRVIEIDKGVVRLLPVAERTKQLFGDDGADAMADQLESNPTAAPQLALFPDADSARPNVKGRGRRKAGPNAPDAAFETRREATTLDRVHAAMLLQRAGRAVALRALLSAEQDRGPDFLRLANALSALYPRESEEKRLIDAMLLAVPR